MLDFTEQPFNQNLFSQGCAVGTGEFEPHIHREEASLVSIPCENPMRFNIVSCKDPNKRKFIDEVGGLALDKKLSSVEVMLPSYIPVIDKAVSNFPHWTIPSSVIGVSLIDTIDKGMEYKAGSWHEEKEIRFRTRLLLGEAVRGKKSILFATGQDTLIERLWWDRNNIHLFENLSAMGFSMITGMNFSVMKGECPFGQRLNQKKALCSAFLAEQSGMQAILHIYTINKFHMTLWTRYLIENQQIRIVAMNCQLQKSTGDREKVISSILNLMQGVPQELHIVLLGFPLHLIHRFGIFLDRIHFADKVPAKCAQSRKKLFIDPSTLRMGSRFVDESVDLLFTHNINQRRLYIEIVKQKILEDYKLPQEIRTLLSQNNFWVKDEVLN